MIPNLLEISVLALCIFLIVALMNMHSMSDRLAKWKLGITDDQDQAPPPSEDSKA